MKLIVGLGNPGAKYAGNRHNIGFMAADSIVRRHASFGPWQKKFSAEISEGRVEGEKLLIIKPQTFMNVSGQAVGEAMRFYKLGADAITVFYDELDLLHGKVRIKTGGGHGGHNGIKSMDAHCGKDYQRVRLGIGHPGSKERVNSHVLGDFAKADQKWLDPLIDTIGDEIGLLIKGDNSGFMNKLALAIGDTNFKPLMPKQENERQIRQRLQKNNQQSHIRQARETGGKVEAKGPMADMLKKLLGK